MDDHSNEEDAPDDFLTNTVLRIGAVSILTFASDAGLVTDDEFAQCMNSIVNRTHPEHKEEFYGRWGKRIKAE